MNYFLLVSSIAVSVASLIDGISTVRFLKNPDYSEVDTAWLLGKRPSALRVYGLGGAFIATELGAAWGLNHWNFWVGCLFAAGLAVQAFTHIRAARRNFKLPVRRPE